MPAPEQIDRFRRDLEALTGAPSARLGVAVSGGPDSLALLLLAEAACPGRVEAATVDHRLRPEAAEEARFVASVCADLGVPHSILADPDTLLAAANAQAQARTLRYRLLADWAGRRDIAFLATAHHSDDQAETVLMRLARGAGLAGLAAVRPSRRDGALTILRPLLGWRRDELEAIVAGAGLEAVDDPSNRSDAYDRTRFRALLAGTDLLAAPRLAASAAHLAEAEDALAWAVEREWQARAGEEEGIVTLDPSGLPTELVRRLAARAIDTVRGDRDWRRDGLATAIGEVASGRRTTLAGVQISGGQRWRFEPEPPRRAV
ncbi:MAG TPA: tRNA lysidine(34) synthetase TilS [Allosphingosinicella sp.]|nr:tRNA lysidine(34) synthetase TilS [Allosphingosinicella sp.]